MDKPETCYCGYKAYGYTSTDIPMCSIHLATSGAWNHSEYTSDEDKKVFSNNLEQAIVKQVHARIRGD